MATTSPPPSDRTRRVSRDEHPELEHCHGNRQVVWLHPEVAR